MTAVIDNFITSWEKKKSKSKIRSKRKFIHLCSPPPFCLPSFGLPSTGARLFGSKLRACIFNIEYKQEEFLSLFSNWRNRVSGWIGSGLGNPVLTPLTRTTKANVITNGYYFGVASFTVFPLGVLMCVLISVTKTAPNNFFQRKNFLWRFSERLLCVCMFSH